MLGWPGVGVDENTTPEKLAQRDKEGNIQWPATYGQPEFLAYPGAVHHIRNEWQRYVPSYPVYNDKTLVKNFILDRMPEYRHKCVEYAEPVYYNPMYGSRVRTSKTRPSVKAFKWVRGEDVIKLTIGKLEPSLYVVRPIYTAPGVSDPWKKKYVTIRFRVNDDRSDPNKMRTYYLQAQTLDNFYAGQEFFFHAVDDRVYRVELALMPESETDLLVYNVDVHDRFGECAKRRGKKRSTLFDTSERKKRWQRMGKDPEFQKKELVSPEEQRKRDDEVWKNSPPLNFHPTIRGTPPPEFFICRAPEEWAGRDFVIRCLDRKFYAGRTRGTWFWHIYNKPARYTFKGGTVFCRYLEGGRWKVAEVAPYTPDIRFDRTKRLLRKGEETLRRNVDSAWIKGARVYENGKELGKVEKNIRLAGFDANKKYFDKEGRFAQDTVVELGDWAKGKLFYNALPSHGNSCLTGIQHALSSKRAIARKNVTLL